MVGDVALVAEQQVRLVRPLPAALADLQAFSQCLVLLCHLKLKSFAGSKITTPMIWMKHFNEIKTIQ